MKKKLTAFIIAVFLLLSCGFSAFALSGVSIGDVLSIIASVDTSKYTSYSEQEWNTLSSAERAEQINFVISDQKGKSYITDTSDFINDPALSYEYYNLLTNNSNMVLGIPGGSATGNFFSKQYLEQNGLANFDMGYFSSGGSGGHFSGKFGDGTVADTLNGEFIGYIQDNPLDVGFTSVYYQTNDGYKVSFYINYDPESVWTKYDIYTRIVDPNNNIVLDGIPYTKNYSYGDNDISKTSSWLSRFALDYNIVTVYKSDGTIQEIFSLSPWIPDKEGGSSTPVSNDPLATGVDENGNKIQFNINSDGVTYEGSTYNYNDDNSVKPTYKKRSLILKIFYDFPKAFSRDFFQKNPDAMNIHGFYCFCGSQGSGKTIAAIHLLREMMQKYPLINVRSNISISFQSGTIKHWREIVDVHNGEIGQIDFLDEIQNWFSSMESKNFPPEMLQEITQERKKHKVIAGTSQVFTRMSKALREQCTYLCLPTTFFGCFTVVRVYKPEVDDCGSLIGKKFVRVYCFVHDDELRDCYNTYEKVERLARGGFIPSSERTE